MVHVTKTVAGCFAKLRRLRIVLQSLRQEWQDSSTRLVVTLVLSRLDYCNGVLAGLPASQLNRLQSVLHAAARLIYGARRRDHVTPLLHQLHWLSIPERVEFKLCVLMYRCLHGIGPAYFSDDLKLVSEISSRQRLRSASTTSLVIPATRRSTLGDRAFPVIGARLWNALPCDITSASSLSSFRRLLKTYLFRRCYGSD